MLLGEFENVFPVWDWRLIPGTTELQTGTLYVRMSAGTTSLTALSYNCGDLRSVYHSAWVGGIKSESAISQKAKGVSDGLYGGAAFQFVRGHEVTLRVSKAW